MLGSSVIPVAVAVAVWRSVVSRWCRFFLSAPLGCNETARDATTSYAAEKRQKEGAATLNWVSAPDGAPAPEWEGRAPQTWCAYPGW